MSTAAKCSSGPAIQRCSAGFACTQRAFEFQRESGRHFASKGLGVRVPLAPLSALVRGTFAAQEPLTQDLSTAASTATVSGNGLVQLTKAYDSGLEFSAGGVRSGRRSQPQDKRPPRPCIVCGPLRPGDLPPVALGVAYERGTPAPRPVARAATGVAPAVTAASNALSTSSRVPAVQASVTPDHPVGAVLSGAA